jgi:hypothetical protein
VRGPIVGAISVAKQHSRSKTVEEVTAPLKNAVDGRRTCARTFPRSRPIDNASSLESLTLDVGIFASRL